MQRFHWDVHSRSSCDLNRTTATWSAAYWAAEDTHANPDEAPVTTARPRKLTVTAEARRSWPGRRPRGAAAERHDVRDHFGR